MKKYIISFLLIAVAALNSYGQKYYTKTGEITFFSATPIENIEAVSNSASTVIDMSSGKIQWAVLIKSFEFEKALMQEHFNENYMESSKYPKAKFKGQLNDSSKVNLKTDGIYTVDVTGILEIHGIEKELTTTTTFEVSNGEIVAKCLLKVLVADFGIEIPSVVKDNIAKEIEIRIAGNYEILENL